VVRVRRCQNAAIGDPVLPVFSPDRTVVRQRGGVGPHGLKRRILLEQGLESILARCCGNRGEIAVQREYYATSGKHSATNQIQGNVEPAAIVLQCLLDEAAVLIIDDLIVAQSTVCDQIVPAFGVSGSGDQVPAPPAMNTDAVLSTRALFKAMLAVMPATGTAAACSYVREAGFLATERVALEQSRER